MKITRLSAIYKIKTMIKSIEFIYKEDETPLQAVNNLMKILNVKYRHHYLKSKGVGVLEYYDKEEAG